MENYPKHMLNCCNLLVLGLLPLFGKDSVFSSVIFLFLNSWAKEILVENRSKAALGINDFVFWMSQGTMFCFFKLKAEDDPPVYLYTENVPDRFICISTSLTEFIWNCCFDPQIAFSPIAN